MSGLELILNSATGTPLGGVNTARVQNDVGDLCLWSSNNAGIRITAYTGNVGIGKTASYPLDVSGSMNATALAGCITDSWTTSNSTLAASATGLSNVAAIAIAAIPKAGGTVTGSLSVTGTLYASNVSVLGTTEVINAYETHSSNLVINNLVGSGPALSVTQTETTTQPVAAFYAGIGSSNPALMVSGTGAVTGLCSTNTGVFPCLTHRQGSDPSTWGFMYAGTTNYTFGSSSSQVRMQVGYYTVTAAGGTPTAPVLTSGVFTFPVSFSNPPLVFISGGGGSTPCHYTATSLSGTSMNYYITNISSSQTVYFHWMAIGI